MVTTIMYPTQSEPTFVNNYPVEPPILSPKVNRSTFSTNPHLSLNDAPFPLHSSLLQVQLLRAQLQQQKLTDKIIYQSLKDQLDHRSSPLESRSN